MDTLGNEYHVIPTNDEEIEIKLLVEAIRLKYGYDFGQYATPSLIRRIRKGFLESGLKRVSDMIPLLIYDKSFFDSFVLNFSVNVTEIFRDPAFYKELRERTFPYLDTYPSIKAWSAGIATGEEVYSLAIMLKEEELYKKSLIYATDFNQKVLEKANAGICSLDEVKKGTKNYQKYGGRGSFSEYYFAEQNHAVFDKGLRENIVFAEHNLATDGVFGEMNLILCRNVLIYFNRSLRDHVLNLFKDCLCPGGFLCLGAKETLEFSSVADSFSIVSKKYRIYQRKGDGEHGP